MWQPLPPPGSHREHPDDPLQAHPDHVGAEEEDVHGQTQTQTAAVQALGSQTPQTPRDAAAGAAQTTAAAAAVAAAVAAAAAAAAATGLEDAGMQNFSTSKNEL